MVGIRGDQLHPGTGVLYGQGAGDGDRVLLEKANGIQTLCRRYQVDFKRDGRITGNSDIECWAIQRNVRIADNRPLRQRGIVSVLKVSQIDCNPGRAGSRVIGMVTTKNCRVVLILLATVVMLVPPSPANRVLAQDTPARGYWVDPSTGL